MAAPRREEDERLLLDAENGAENHDFSTPRKRNRPSSLFPSKKVVLLHAAVAATYILLISALIAVVRPKSGSCECDKACSQQNALYSPANDALQYSPRVMAMDPSTFMVGNPFVGDPREELDDAWDGLLQNIQIRASPDEFAQLRPQLNRSSLQLPDGGYIIRLRVYHELHCLKWIRKWMHREHYWPDLSGYALHERRWHIEHCLEEFRMHAMCKPSLAPATFNFVDRSASDEITADGSHVERCVDWGLLQKWADERRVDLNAVDRSSLIDDSK